MRRKIYLLLFLSFLAAAVLWASASQERQKPTEPEPEEFIPSEKVPADTAVSFPVDI